MAENHKHIITIIMKYTYLGHSMTYITIMLAGISEIELSRTEVYLLLPISPTAIERPKYTALTANLERDS